MRARPLLVVGVLVSGLSGAAEPSDNPYLAHAIAEIRALHEAEALKTLDRARLWAHEKPADLAWVHLYTGLAYAGLANHSKAVKSFRTALLLDANLVLPEWPSPVVRAWWTEAGGRTLEVTPPGPAGAPVSAKPPSLSSVVPAPPPDAPPLFTQTVPKLTVAPSNRWPPSKWAALGAFAASVITLGVGIWEGQRASDMARAAQADPSLTSALPKRRAAEQDALSANVLFGVTGGLAAGGAICFAW